MNKEKIDIVGNINVFSEFVANGDMDVLLKMKEQERVRKEFINKLKDLMLEYKVRKIDIALCPINLRGD